MHRPVLPEPVMPTTTPCVHQVAGVVHDGLVEDGLARAGRTRGRDRKTRACVSCAAYSRRSLLRREVIEVLYYMRDRRGLDQSPASGAAIGFVDGELDFLKTAVERGGEEGIG